MVLAVVSLLMHLVEFCLFRKETKLLSQRKILNFQRHFGRMETHMAGFNLNDFVVGNHMLFLVQVNDIST